MRTERPNGTRTNGNDNIDIQQEINIQEQEEAENITTDEIIDTLKKFKNGKAPRHDSISPEMLKYMGDAEIKSLADVCNAIWNEKQISQGWDVGIILPICKKGEAKDCNNYRGIILLCSTFKVYEGMLEHRLKQIAEPTLSEAQSEF